MMKRIVNYAVTCTVIVVLFTACNNNQNNNGETLYRGNAVIASDEEVFDLIRLQIDSFMSRHEGANINLTSMTAVGAMVSLLRGEVRAAFIARDYTKEEDSLLQSHSIESHKRLLIATDALVFVVDTSTQLDTLSHEDIIRTLRGEITSLSRYRIAVPDLNSSIITHMKNIAGIRELKLNATYGGTGDSVISRIVRRSADIGTILFSQYNRSKDRNNLRALRIIIRDTATGDRIAITPHAATIVKERYPYRIPIYGYLLETARNFPYGVIASIAHEPEHQRAMLQAGIVPGYAKIHLVEQE